MINLDLTPSMSFEWLIALIVILYTRLHITPCYDASRILWLQINQQTRMNRFDCSIWLPSPNNERLSKWRLNPAWKRFIPLFCKIIVHTYLETRKSMVTFPICTLAIHPFIWGGADVAGDCLWSNDMHITLMCYQLSYPYIFCTLYP